MKKFLMVIGGALLVLGACGDDEAGEAPDAVDENGVDEEVEDDDDENGEEEENGDAEENGGDTYDADEMHQVYEENCLSCHGDNLEGGGAGPGIDGMDEDEVLTAIEEGPGSMPADLVEDEEAEQLSAWVSDQ
ncbi:c-type cytochrome [Salsuginibacillus kocurii]|uniref:c-type cytochrome n=1 Tax=Salsuginibacillus kocurii TaxID=427078 RepID=UPI000364DCE1|nr:cytochrome c [Salsuginibacillus kocurii]